MSDISIEHLTAQFNNHPVLADVTMRVPHGEFFVLVGPSGSGKSTLLRLIAGLLTPSQGTIRFNGKIMNSLSARERNVAMVFQNYALYPHKNAFDNIAFGLRAHRIPEKEVHRRVRNVAAMLNIEKLLSRWPKELSGGERQRVAIGRAIVRDPEVYLLDEPLSNLDAKLRVEMRNELSKLQKDLNETFIYVTHDQIEAMTLGERIAVINEGKIEQVGTPENLYDYPKNKFVAGFIGAPSMNFIEGKLFYDEQKGCFCLKRPSGVIPINGATTDVLREWSAGKVILGIRPESVILGTSDAASVRAKVQRVEPIGHEGFVYLNFCGITAITRIKNWKKYRNATHVMVAIRFKNTYLFAIKDGNTILSKGRRANVS
jgi:multiple sugar transport system ATP-binding protein